MEDIDKRIQGALAIRVSVFGVENIEGETLPFGTQYLVAMPVQYELRRLFHLMNIQTHRNSTQKALF